MKEEEKPHKMKQHSGGFLELWTIRDSLGKARNVVTYQFAFDNTIDATNKEVQWHNQPG